jgi:hypothetical protein
MKWWPVLLCAFVMVAERLPAADLNGFASCLSRAGATYYFAAWCPHCARQNQMFGDALHNLRTVDCTRGCDDVRSFPTWKFADGSRIGGVASFDQLASRTGCRLGAERRSVPAESGWSSSATGHGTRERYQGGAKIIEIPGR